MHTSMGPQIKNLWAKMLLEALDIELQMDMFG